MPAFNDEKNDALWNVLHRHPNGVTAKVAANELKWTPVRASQLLGKLAMYGVIDRVPHPSERGYRYSTKAPANETTILGAG